MGDARAAALAAMLAVWHDRAADGVQASPQEHCEALLDAAWAAELAAVQLVHERRNGWCDACGGTGADGVDHIDVYSEPKPCTPVPCPSFDEVRMALVPRMDVPTVAELRQAGAAIYRFGDTFWSLRDGAVVVIDMAGNVVAG